jgi:mannitol-1-/sugar-/sorbitol-6-phosphatase
MTQERPDALLLDLDGTLVDSEPLHREAYRQFFADRGWEAPDLSLFTGRRAEDVFATEPGPWTGSDPAELSAGVMAYVRGDVAPDPVPGAEELVRDAVSSGVRVAVVTSAGPDWVELSLGVGLDVLHLVEVLVTKEHVVDGKPDPAGYLLACRRLGTDPGRCVAVEDSPAGVSAAMAAGVGAVYGVRTTHPAPALVAAGAGEVYPDLTGVAAALGIGR